MRDIYYEREFLTKRGGGAVKPLCSCCLLLLAVAGCLLWLAAAAVRVRACARVFCVSQPHNIDCCKPFLFCSFTSFSSLFITIITSHHHHYLLNQYIDIQVCIYIYISNVSCQKIDKALPKGVVQSLRSPPRWRGPTEVGATQGGRTVVAINSQMARTLSHRI